MLRSQYQICTLFGIPIRLDSSLIILFILMISDFRDPVMGVGAGLLLLISIVLHELGHSLTAMAFGCKVRDITLMMIGGAATLTGMPKKAWQEFLVAIAGPLVSLILGLVGILCFQPLVYRPTMTPTFSCFIHYNLGWLNMGLFLFNLIPAFPMDGGRVLRSILRQFFMGKVKATWLASRIGKGIAILFVVSVAWSFLTGQFQSWYLIRLLIAFFIWRSAEREYRMVAMEEGGEFQGRGCLSSLRQRERDVPPEDDGKAVVSPPPYERWGAKTRVDVRRERK